MNNRLIFLVVFFIIFSACVMLYLNRSKEGYVTQEFISVDKPWPTNPGQQWDWNTEYAISQENTSIVVNIELEPIARVPSDKTYLDIKIGENKQYISGADLVNASKSNSSSFGIVVPKGKINMSIRLLVAQGDPPIVIKYLRVYADNIKPQEAVLSTERDEAIIFTGTIPSAEQFAAFKSVLASTDLSPADQNTTMNAVTGFLSKQMNDLQFKLLIEPLGSKLTGQDKSKIEMALTRLIEGKPITTVPAAPSVVPTASAPASSSTTSSSSSAPLLVSQSSVVSTESVVPPISKTSIVSTGSVPVSNTASASSCPPCPVCTVKSGGLCSIM